MNKYSLKNILFFLLALLKFLISPLIRINLFRFSHAAFGHMNHDTTVNYYFGKKNCLFFLNIFLEDKDNKFISSIFLYKKWKKKLFIISTNSFINKVIYFDFKFFSKKYHPQYKFEEIFKDKYYKPLIRLEKPEKELCLSFLENLNIKHKQKWICFANRDNSFRPFNYKNKTFKDISSEDNIRNSRRNFDIYDCEEAIREFIKEGYFVFRVGKDSEKKLEINDTNFFDLTKLDENQELINFFILKNTKLLISPDNGTCSIPLIYNKNFTHINCASLWHRQRCLDYVKLPFLTKIVLNKEKKKIKFSEYNKYDLLENIQYNKIEFINNTPAEIRELAKEIIKIFNNNIHYSREEYLLKKRYIDIINSLFKKNNFKLNENSPTLGISFLKNHEYLLK